MPLGPPPTSRECGGGRVICGGGAFCTAGARGKSGGSRRAWRISHRPRHRSAMVGGSRRAGLLLYVGFLDESEDAAVFFGECFEGRLVLLVVVHEGDGVDLDLQVIEVDEAAVGIVDLPEV